jgi:hypothetical protein
MKLVALFLTQALLTASETASAEQAKATANRLFQQGEASFAHRDFKAAAVAFEQAARLAPHPAVWLNAAEAWVRAQNLIAAGADCDAALAMPNLTRELRTEASRRLAWIEARLGRLELEGQTEIAVVIDRSPSVVTPASIRLAPGTHKLKFADPKNQRAREIHVDLEAGKVTKLELQSLGDAAAEDAAAAGEASSSEGAEPGPQASEDGALPRATSSGFEQPLFPLPDLGSGPPIAADVAFAASGVALIVGSVFGALTLSAKSTYDDGPTQERADHFFAMRLTTNIAFAFAAIAAATGALLWALDDSPE